MARGKEASEAYVVAKENRRSQRRIAKWFCMALGQTSEAPTEVADALAVVKGLSTVEVASDKACVKEMRTISSACLATASGF